MDAAFLFPLGQASTVVRKVAILRASRLGDFLLAVPALRALRHALPRAEVVFIGLPRVEPLVRRCRYVDRFEPFPGFPGIADQFYGPARTLAFLARMQRERFDLALQLHGSGAYSNLFASLLGARATVGFCRPGETVPWLTHTLPFPETGHEVHRLLRLIESLGIAPRGDHLEFPLLPDDEDEVAALPSIRSTRAPLIVLHPGAEISSKRWPVERFIAVGRELARKMDALVAATGLASEGAVAQRVAAEIGPAGINLAGRLSIGGLGALTRRAALVVTNDTVTAHVAYALGAPSVTIFGPQEPARWGPLDVARHAVVAHDVPCRPCDHDPCPIDHRCLLDIPASEVLAASTRITNRR